ncbi:hypothetical protein JQU17_17740 [Ponticoccus sp. SC2-23]|uniref:hypothetical protein n=1 Tax=Alexandriicola marinus TaxID=2081710 RepID=UPI0013DF5429|nr:hypothetical protein [Alexandriicola marinus]MBM1222061.1 hypothetical protein [Ponticoccus sp. SC6-9]MBM1226748.1 hypothetical protein [Ponticoccus sp. SC6-15]MBM1231008.1 hypothetical protein [Ponticoccus sp. SC6-38]MBM1235740.1 hypothetical protein [Ponticoccus sp. SC6-45]MBM1240030.1 hypothetical protein [Ponticoccus sp. SC6-49]MBM1244384.1 hypothetical protein [Ponticoccus sp. SC2-64]MBM1249214.1 hypothetical protein [Ponticoccus sp. SC6-42]MBM1253685.1 hypothetical protein [Pontico
MSAETFAREDEVILKMLQEWPDLLKIMDIAPNGDHKAPREREPFSAKPRPSDTG